ncbi:hypothetical protein PBI_GAIA_136 [Mycobacterium phage Gaia]|uniref:HNH nuclease domain-containing protein n=1 Tax=Mycobacterium phage Gaia TaxID=1486472 RepID=A0A068F8W5_9CAUD|nr:HNH endonuclease [Mycobacterium phage Gaia]AID58955.1 hypothetical protein PBI_GAIA_136 [Mycobacterium phage Gaia]
MHTSVISGFLTKHYGRWQRANSKATECSIDDCERPSIGRGWCSTHYGRWQRTGDPLGLLRGKPRSADCSVADEDCDYGSKGRLIKGMCQRHYARMYRSGSVKAFSEKECVNCGTQFVARSRKAITCSRICYSRYVHGRGDKSCVRCGTGISHLVGPVQYCSDDCRAAGRLATEESEGTRPCESCRRPMVVSYALQKYCSTACNAYAQRHPGEQRMVNRGCVICAEPLSDKKVSAKYCSEKCHTRAAYDKKRHRPAELNCELCDAPFRTKMARQRFCNPKCAGAWHKQSRRYAGGPFVEHVSISVLADRDGYVCQLCGNPVDMSLRFPDSGSASMDHIMPVSLGGEHSYANTQLAHLFCNIRKGNRI